MNFKNLDLNDPRNRIIVALDNIFTFSAIQEKVKLLKDHVGFFKIGFQMIHSIGGPQAISAVKSAGGRAFYDCKLNDTNDTMKAAAEKIAEQKVEIFNVHASAGVEAMKSVQSVCGDSVVSGVSVLTSLSNEDCIHIFNKPTITKVTNFAEDIVKAGLPSIICSAMEAKYIKGTVETSGLVTITPGIRPEWAVPNDQDKSRIMTPYKAIKNGSDLLVIGRPILQPPAEIGDPLKAVKMITEEISKALLE